MSDEHDNKKDARIAELEREVDTLRGEIRWLRYIASKHLGYGFDSLGETAEHCSGCHEQQQVS